jgi:hypothetical protein
VIVVDVVVVLVLGFTIVVGPPEMPVAMMVVGFSVVVDVVVVLLL